MKMAIGSFLLGQLFRWPKLTIAALVILVISFWDGIDKAAMSDVLAVLFLLSLGIMLFRLNARSRS